MAALDRGMEQQEAAETFNQYRTTIVMWLDLRHGPGDIEPKPAAVATAAASR